ncbi:hypothetical protein [Amycolatopsis tucumanensis]|uniref:hypothetical protein n=1 Tax=Amycolatopsis tucumanensis TaxID=401106 RepID=UPI001F4715F7|nr:hypothetical protein [Amycolatopsis tucumanensis]MCF6422879.1 hypothetical protein [Amycolatopsis tucumanensis]
MTGWRRVCPHPWRVVYGVFVWIGPGLTTLVGGVLLFGGSEVGSMPGAVAAMVFFAGWSVLGFRLSRVGVHVGAEGVRYCTLTRTCTKPWRDVVGFELRRYVVAQPVAEAWTIWIITSTGPPVETDIGFIRPHHPRSLRSAAEVRTALTELHAALAWSRRTT